MERGRNTDFSKSEIRVSVGVSSVAPIRILCTTRSPSRFVLVFGLLFGLNLAFISPPFSVPDELAHFLRAYHCSQGKFYAPSATAIRAMICLPH